MSKPAAVVVLSAEEIQGIIYFVDEHHNVYHTDDVIHDTGHRRIIGKLNPTYTNDTVEERITWYSEYAPFTPHKKGVKN